MAYFTPYLDGSGLHLPTYEDRLQNLITAYRSIFGIDAELSPAVPDYQLLSVFARALDDCGALLLAVYNSRNPALASGQALDLLLPLYGLSRLPDETDAAARDRIATALAGRGNTLPEGILAAIKAVSGVKHAILRINETDTTVDSIPAHTLAAVVENGSLQKIAEAIYAAKPPGIGTYGTTTKQVTGADGQNHPISLSRPQTVYLNLHVTLHGYAGFDADAVTAAMKAALLTHVNTDLDIGQGVILPQLYGLLYASAASAASTFAITGLEASTVSITTTEAVTVSWNQKLSIPVDGGVIFTVT